jgi:hypothetical protein
LSREKIAFPASLTYVSGLASSLRRTRSANSFRSIWERKRTKSMRSSLAHCRASVAWIRASSRRTYARRSSMAAAA